MLKKLLKSSGVFILMAAMCGFADEAALPKEWSTLNPILMARYSQADPKMRLTEPQIDALALYLQREKANSFLKIQLLQETMPKTALELLFAVQARGLPKAEAEKMAAYLPHVPRLYHIKKVALFDENTSHIIGREWSEIDYAGEGMTWQGQKAKYAKHGITNFKTLENLKKFFPVESQLVYFDEIYR